MYIAVEIATCEISKGDMKKVNILFTKKSL
jgi:hypothetical protein